jgi:hypothetical protein
LAKLEAILLRGEAVGLCAKYFPGRTTRESLEAGVRLTQSLVQADSFRDLANRLAIANEKGFRAMIAEIEKMQRFGLSYRSREAALCAWPTYRAFSVSVPRCTASSCKGFRWNLLRCGISTGAA